MPTTTMAQLWGVLLTDREAAACFNFSRATLWRRVADGTVPRPIKIGGATRWLPDEIEAVVEAARAARDLQGAE